MEDYNKDKEIKRIIELILEIYIIYKPDIEYI